MTEEQASYEYEVLHRDDIRGFDVEALNELVQNKSDKLVNLEMKIVDDEVLINLIFEADGETYDNSLKVFKFDYVSEERFASLENERNLVDDMNLDSYVIAKDPMRMNKIAVLFEMSEPHNQILIDFLNRVDSQQK